MDNWSMHATLVAHLGRVSVTYGERVSGGCNHVERDADAYLARGSRDAVRHHAVQAYTREEQPEQSEPDRQRRQYPVRVPARRLTFTSRALRRDSIEAFSSLRPPDHSLQFTPAIARLAPTFPEFRCRSLLMADCGAPKLHPTGRRSAGGGCQCRCSHRALR
jgi:hypothetical protein